MRLPGVALMVLACVACGAGRPRGHERNCSEPPPVAANWSLPSLPPPADTYSAVFDTLWQPMLSWDSLDGRLAWASADGTTLIAARLPDGHERESIFMLYAQGERVVARHVWTDFHPASRLDVIWDGNGFLVLVGDRLLAVEFRASQMVVRDVRLPTGAPIETIPGVMGDPGVLGPSRATLPADADPVELARARGQLEHLSRVGSRVAVRMRRTPRTPQELSTECVVTLDVSDGAITRDCPPGAAPLVTPPRTAPDPLPDDVWREAVALIEARVYNPWGAGKSHGQDVLTTRAGTLVIWVDVVSGTTRVQAAWVRADGLPGMRLPDVSVDAAVVGLQAFDTRWGPLAVLEHRGGAHVTLVWLESSTTSAAEALDVTVDEAGDVWGCTQTGDARCGRVEPTRTRLGRVRVSGRPIPLAGGLWVLAAVPGERSLYAVFDAHTGERRTEPRPGHTRPPSVAMARGSAWYVARADEVGLNTLFEFNDGDGAVARAYSTTDLGRLRASSTGLRQVIEEGLLMDFPFGAMGSVTLGRAHTRTGEHFVVDMMSEVQFPAWSGAVTELAANGDLVTAYFNDGLRVLRAQPFPTRAGVAGPRRADSSGATPTRAGPPPPPGTPPSTL